MTEDDAMIVASQAYLQEAHGVSKLGVGLPEVGDMGVQRDALTLHA